MRRFITDIIAEAHRRSIWQVLGVYLLASWFGYEVVLALTDGVGLPAWVPPFAIVLFVIGLPVVLATAIVQEGHPLQSRPIPDHLEPGGVPRAVPGLETAADTVAAERASPEPDRRAVRPQSFSPSSPRSIRFLTWNRAITAGVLAFAGLGLAATGFLGMRTLGIGPAATLVSSGVLEERSVVVLADFAAEDEGTAEVVTEALRINLHQSTVMNLADAGYLADVLRRMERDPSEPFTAAVAREVAEREGLKAVLTGEVRELGGRYVLSARVEGADGSVLAGFREDAADEASLLEAVDALSTQIREKVGESLRAVRRAEPLEAVSTSSLEALRLYSRGVNVADRTADYLRAAEFFERAVEVDSTFAMAWRKLGVMLSNSGASEARYAEAYRRAFELRDRLPDQERYLAEAVYYRSAVGDDDAAAQAYRTLLELDPDHTAALNNLALINRDRGRAEEAAALLRRAVRVEPAPLYLANLANAELALGNLDAADSAIAAGLDRSPDHLSLLMWRAAVANVRGDHATIESTADRLTAAHPDGRGALIADLLRSVVDGRQGRIRAMMDHFRASDERARRLGLNAYLVTTTGLGAELPMAVLGDTAETLRRVDAALADPELARLGPSQRGHAWMAQILARAGETDRAASLLDESRREHEAAGVRFDEGYASFPQAVIARVRDQHDRALELLRRAEEAGAFAAEVELERARVHESAGRPDSAIAAYERALAAPGFDRFAFDIVHLAFILQRTAELLDDRGDTARAIEHYARFVDLWQDADPELQPRVESVRRRLGVLVGEDR